MGLRINTNLNAMSASRALNSNGVEQQKTFQRLATGNRITSSGDDAAGLAISEKLKSQIRSLGQAERNAGDGISLLQVAEGGMSETTNMISRMRELAIQASSDTIGDEERSFINKEVQGLKQEISRIADVTTFNGVPLLNGEAKTDLSIQIGARKEDVAIYKPQTFNMKAESLGIDGMDFSSANGARDSLDVLDSAMNKVSGSRAELGAFQNKMQSTLNNISVQKENISVAKSRISDADVAKETSELARSNVLQQAGVAILGQANQSPLAALRLLG